MPTKEKSFNQEGTIYAKNVRKVVGKKDPTKEYEFRTIVLEVKTTKEVKRDDKIQYISKTNLLEFDIASWIDIEDYSVGDYIDIRFIIEGVEYNKKDGEKGYMNKLKTTYIKYADIDSGDGKKASSKYTPPTQREEVFVVPDPEDVDQGDLPF